MYFACDIGGTKTRIAISNNCVDFDEPIIFDTPKDPNVGLKKIIEEIRKAIQNDTLSFELNNKVEGICLGIAGVLEEDHASLAKSPHLPTWENIEIKNKMIEEFNCPVFIENDTDIVGLGEAMVGAGRGYELVVYMTISTGIGGVKINRGKFVNNVFGFEPGFQILNWQTGENFEDLASGTAVEKKFGMHPKDVAQTENWKEIEDIIAVGLHNSIVHWSPDILVIGGSMSKDLRAEILREKISKIMKIHPHLPEIKIATLGSIGGLHGGLAYLRQKLFLE